MKEETKGLVKAYLDGVDIEYKGTSLDFAFCPWNKARDLMFRKKPVVKKTVGYKRYVYESCGQLYIGIAYEDDCGDPPLLTMVLDKEWQYAEYAEDE